MNKVILMGRLTRDPDINYVKGGDMCMATFTVAVDRNVSKDAEQTADFPRCTALGKTGEFVEKYFHKGNKIAIEGRIQTGSYKNQEGRTIYTTDVFCERVEFVESKNAASGSTEATTTKKKQEKAPETDDDGFMNIPDSIDDLPFG